MSREGIALQAPLIQRAQRGDEEAMEQLLALYRPLLLSLCKRYFLPTGEPEDLYQEAMIGFHQAVQKVDRLETFPVLAKRCVENHLRDVIKGALRKKHSLLTMALSMSEQGQSFSIDAMMEDKEEASPEARLLEKEGASALLTGMKTRLSALELEALLLQAKGQSYKEMAARLGRSPKAIEAALRRARRKLKLFLEEDAHVQS